MFKKSMVVLLLIGLLIISCGGCTKKEVSQSGKPLFGFASKTTADPMFIKTFEGFKIACDELGIETVYRGTDDASAEKEIEIINQFIAQNVAGIAIIAADYDAFQPMLQEAMRKGIPVISVDSAVNPASRQIAVEFCDIVELGRNEFRSAAAICGGKGKIAILSGDPRVKAFMDTEEGIWDEYNSGKYPGIEVVKQIYYGYDLPDQSTTEGQALVKTYPDVDVIICTTTVAILSMGKIIQDQGLNMKITGIGLPSEMYSYFENGICPEMWLWDVYDYGYLSAHALYELYRGNITGAVGETFNAGKMGSQKIEKHEDGGTMVLLGNGFKFDMSNIQEWKDKL